MKRALGRQNGRCQQQSGRLESIHQVGRIFSFRSKRAYGSCAIGAQHKRIDNELRESRATLDLSWLEVTTSEAISRPSQVVVRQLIMQHYASRRRLACTSWHAGMLACWRAGLLARWRGAKSSARVCSSALVCVCRMAPI